MNTEQQQEIIDYFTNNLIENTLYTIGGVPKSGKSFILKELIGKYFKEGKDVVVVLLETNKLKQDISGLNSFSLDEEINFPDGTITVIEPLVNGNFVNFVSLINNFSSHLNPYKKIIFIDSIDIICSHDLGMYQLLDDLSKVFTQCPVIATFQMVQLNTTNVTSKLLYLTKF